MGEMFDVAELVRVAVEDERTGVAFYGALAGKVRDADLRKTFADLAEQERGHQRRFEQMLARLGEHKPAESYGDEYAAYLDALTAGRAFPDEPTAMRMAEECPDDLAAVEMSSRFERDTLMLMQEMQGLVPARHRATVEELADEEREHLVVLSAARHRLRG